MELIEGTWEIEALRDAYLAAGLLGPASIRDAEHVAAATVARADLVVSWNFKHIVHYDKMRGSQEINITKGYDPIVICSPPQVV